MLILEKFVYLLRKYFHTTKIYYNMKVVLQTLVIPSDGGRKKFKRLEKPISSINDLKQISHAIDVLKSFIIDDLTIFDDGTNDYIKYAISIVYKDPK